MTTGVVILCAITFIFNIDNGVALAIPRAACNSSVHFPSANKFPIHYNFTDEIDNLGSSSSDDVIVDVNPPKIEFSKRPTSCNDCVCGAGRKNRIVGGTATNIAEFPWMVGMTMRGQFHCGGSLITRRHVLTAAHCLEGFDKRQFEIHLGDYRVAESSFNTTRRRIKNWSVHEDFNSYNLNNDIGVVELDRPVSLDGFIRTACLPENRAIDYTGSLAIAIGWGKTTENGDLSTHLQKVKVPVLSDEECDEAGYQKARRTENMFCAGYLEGLRDACAGDSGGPLLVNGPRNHLEIIGITSFGRGCARPRYPGVYTKLTNYLGWLSDKLNNECVCPNST